MKPDCIFWLGTPMHMHNFSSDTILSTIRVLYQYRRPILPTEARQYVNTVSLMRQCQQGKLAFLMKHAVAIAVCQFRSPVVDITMLSDTLLAWVASIELMVKAPLMVD